MKHPDRALKMIEFVLWLNKYGIDFSKLPTPKEWDSKFVVYVINYAKFLQQTLTLNMFVPCDKNGKPLEKPIDRHRETCYTEMVYQLECKACQQAERSVIFAGWIWKKKEASLKLKHKDYTIQLNHYKNIEDLITCFPDIAITENYYSKIIK